MKTKIKYVASDDAEFDLQKDCIDHEHLLTRMEIIENEYLGGPQNKKVAYNQGYYQHSKKNIKDAWIEVIELAKPLWKGFKALEGVSAEKIHPMGLAGRIISDCNSPLNKIWHRFMCIDEDGREWQQPYFAANKGTGTQIQIN